MIELTTVSLSDNLSFDEVIQSLQASPLVDGIAAFGSHAAKQTNPASLAGTWRAYFDLRGLAWTGEKAAVRHWLQHDRTCYERVQAVLTAGERQQRLQAYRQLVDYVLMPVGALLSKGQTAVILSDMNNGKMVNEVIDYWNGLLR